MAYDNLSDDQVKEINYAFGTAFDSATRGAFLRAVDKAIGLINGADVTAATTTTRGTVLEAASVSNVTPAADGTAVGTAFNNLLANLRASGVLNG